MLKDRLKVAIPLILVTFLSFFLPGLWGKSAFALLAAAILFTANHEGVVLTGMKPFGAQEWLLDLLAVGLLAGSWTEGAANLLLVLPFLMLSFLIAFFRPVTPDSLKTVANTILVGLFVDVNLSFMADIFYVDVYPEFEGTQLGPMTVAFMVVVTKIADIGAYAVGTLTSKLPGGNHKLSPHVSPKKSWEGLLGGIVFSVGAAFLFLKFSKTLPLTWTSAVLLGVLAATLGLLGDLSESLLKRAAGAKDSGKIPGLGGALDVVDSLIPMGAVFYAWLMLF